MLDYIACSDDTFCATMPIISSDYGHSGKLNYFEIETTYLFP